MLNGAHPIVYLHKKTTMFGCTALGGVYGKTPQALKIQGAGTRVHFLIFNRIITFLYYIDFAWIFLNNNNI